MNLLYGVIPADMAKLLCYLRSRLQNLRALYEALLYPEFHIVLYDGVNSQAHELRSKLHKPVMDISGSVFRTYLAHVPVHYASGVHSFVNHEGSHSGSLFPVYHSPVDRGRTAVLRKKGSMKVECPELRDFPYHLRKHPECHDHENVRLPCLQGLYEIRVFERYRLQDRYPVLHGIFLHRALIDLKAASACLVRYSDNSDDLVSVLEQLLKRCYGKFRRTHIYDTRLLENSHYLCFSLSESVADISYVEY